MEHSSLTRPGNPLPGAGFLPGKKAGQLWMVKCFVLEVEVKHHHQLENSNHLNGLIPCFLRFLPRFMLRFAEKVRGKKTVPKNEKPRQIQLTWVGDGSARPGTKSLGYGSESITQFISSISTRCIWVICLQFIYITSSITILNRYDIPIIYLYLYHSIYYDNRYVCIIKRIYETYTAFCCLCIFSFLFSVTYYIELNDPPVIAAGKS